MANLRLVGVQEDGEHLILSSEDGANFSLRIDEALRVAASSTLTRPEADHHPETFTPRDIQARIRAGATPEQIAVASKLPLEHIHKYEGPVLAERAHIAELAQKIIGRQSISEDHGFSPLDAHRPSTREIIDYQLKNNGIDATDASWDAWRQNDGSWLIILSFRLTNETTIQQARWGFSVSSQKLQPLDAWARRLSRISGGEQREAPLRSAANDDKPGSTALGSSANAPSSPTPNQTVDSANTEAEPATYGLLDKLRSRRGQRLGANEEDEDEIALFLARKNNDASKEDLYGSPTAVGPVEPGLPVLPLPKEPIPVDKDTAKILPFRDPSQQEPPRSEDFYTVHLRESYDKTFSPSLRSSSDYEKAAPPAEYSLKPQHASDKTLQPQPLENNDSEILRNPAPFRDSVSSAEQASLPRPIVSVGSEGKATIPKATVSLPPDAVIYDPALNDASIGQSSAANPETLAPSRRDKKYKTLDENSTASLPLPHPVAASSGQSPEAYHHSAAAAEGRKKHASSSEKNAASYDQETPPDAFNTNAITERAKKKTARSKRSSVPSWDDIVFGTKGDS